MSPVTCHIKKNPKNFIIIKKLDKVVELVGGSTDVHVRIFWCYYYDTNKDFTREIEEEKLEYKDAIYTWFKTLLS